MLQANRISNRATPGRPSKQKFLWALLLFAILSQCFAFFHFGAGTSKQSSEQSWTAWAVGHFTKGLATAPAVVFLGSSLVLTPINMSDAEVLGQTIDGSQHHESVYFAQLIEKMTGRHITAFNFALPGEMPSDAYLITKHLLRGSRKPELIIYGVGPRDFMDNLLASPTATDPYRYLSKLSEQAPDKAFTSRKWDQQIDGLLAKLVYPYGKREALCEQFGSSMKTILERQIPDVPNDRKFTGQKMRALIPLYRPLDIATGECLFQPIRKQTSKTFTDNIEEYRRRYGTLNWDTFLSQLTFLANFLDLTRQQRIETVIVAMPVTKANRSLIPNFAWNAYKRSLRVISFSKGAQFIDLEETKQFSEADFQDTVHLNTIGGIKMVQLIVAEVLQQGKLKGVNQTVGQVTLKQTAGESL